MICEFCKCIYPKKKQPSKYCSRKCRDRTYFCQHTEKINLRNRKWQDKNRAKVRAGNKIAVDKFRSDSPERFNELMRGQYHKNKLKHRSRIATRKIFLGQPPYKKIEFEESFYKCKKCQGRGKEIHHEIYPTRKADILQAISDGKIYFLCKEDHDKVTAKERMQKRRHIG